MKSEERPIDSEKCSTPSALEETTVKIEKEDEKELVKLPVIVKLEKPFPESEEKKIIKEESDSFKENVKPVKVEMKECKADPRDIKGSMEKLEPERLEFVGNVKSSQEITEKSTEAGSGWWQGEYLPKTTSSVLVSCKLIHEASTLPSSATHT